MLRHSNLDKTNNTTNDYTKSNIHGRLYHKNIQTKISAGYSSVHGYPYRTEASPSHLRHQHYSTQKCNQTHHPGSALVADGVTAVVIVHLASTG